MRIPRSVATLVGCLHEAMKRFTKLPRLVLPGRSIDKISRWSGKGGFNRIARRLGFRSKKRLYPTNSPRLQSH
jgi:hypothetical protein